MLKEAQQQKENDEKIKQEAETRNEAENLIRSAESDYLQNDLVPEDDKAAIRQKITDLQAAVDSNRSDVKELHDALKDTVLGVGAKMYQGKSQQETPPQGQDEEQHKDKQ